ncbi:MAG TPA: hypothetical protein VET86_10940, partial [Casimicrobiaceae bacterium]|nr:hypothetical protein [Casimicrobiaceae bacterium]
APRSSWCCTICTSRCATRTTRSRSAARARSPVSRLTCFARMLRELEDPAAAMALGDAVEAKLARKKRGPVLPPLALTLPAAARSH